MNRRLTVAVAGALVLTGLSWSSGTSAEPPPPEPSDTSGGLSVYTGVVDADGLAAIVALGVDRHELKLSPVAGAEGDVVVEVIVSGQQAADLAAAGADLARKDEGAREQAPVQPTVFRPYSGPGGIQEELIAQAAAFPRIAQLQVIGQSVNGQDIMGVRVTKDATRLRPGRRPVTVYLSAQHAREWITPEMTRRLLDLVLSSYGTDPRITNLVDTTEMWFIPVANPDGYDYTFADSENRLWRKNLRDNNGDGQITGGDGVDLNRNFPTRWGYDNEGSSPNPGSETYRGPAPASEPETQAINSLFGQIKPKFLINYHSAAELLLYGIGWQVATPSPDDVLYESMAGTDANPAIAGYDPDISAELYTTNGDTDSHLQEAYGTLGFTPEMATCETASASSETDPYEPEDCESGFNFPDDEGLIQAEFVKNVPFALAVAESAKDPDDPVSVPGIDTPNFVVDSFGVSYGDPQTVAVTAKRALRGLSFNYRINGGRARRAQAPEWAGGERYGFENNDYYAEFRGVVSGATEGAQVEAWFSATNTDRNAGPVGRVESEHFTYTVQSDSGAPVLIVANEDYTGVNPGGPVAGPKYIDEHVAALQANGVQPDVWDVDAQGVPHDLGILSHYGAVLWYLGDNRLTQDPEDEITELPLFEPDLPELPDSSVAERAQYLTISVRDHVNAGGKLIHSGETTGYFGLLNDLFGGGLGGIYYGLDGAPEEECVVATDPFSDCLLLADDFTQYYLGAWSRSVVERAEGVVGAAGPAAGDEATFGGPATVDNPIDEAGAFRLTSDLLPPAEFPDFAGSKAYEYVNASGTYRAIEGQFAAVANHADESYMRLGRTYDLTSISADQQPAFEAQLAYSVEEGYDHVIVEAHTVGQENWTTLPDANGATSSAVPTDCEQDFYIPLHPNLEKYLTPGDPCTTPGSASPGLWNSFTGESGEWLDVKFDLSAYAGQQVEIVVSYVTDPVTGGAGAILDDTRLTTTAGATQAEGFEQGLGAWSVLGPPEGSFDNPSDWLRAEQLGDVTAGVATEDSLLLGFGIEQLEDPADRAELVGDALALIGG